MWLIDYRATAWSTLKSAFSLAWVPKIWKLPGGIFAVLLAEKKQEINFLVKTKEEVENSLNKEKHEVNQMANRMYEVWKNINEVRKDKAYISSSVELKVHNHTDSYGETD